MAETMLSAARLGAQCREGRMAKFLIMLGHGRAIEAYLIGVKLMMGLINLLPGVRPRVLAFEDLLWLPDFWLSLPFLTVGSVQMVGMILNMNGVQCSWKWRTVGAAGGCCLWAWLIFKTVAIGAVGAGALPFWIMSIIASIFLFWRGLNKLPRPGVLGAVE